MSKYIDADKAIAYFNLMYDQTLSADDPYNIGVLGARNYIRFKASSIDIVRCQDCKYWVYQFNGCSRNPCTEPWYATDFCSYGERKDDE